MTEDNSAPRTGVIRLTNKQLRGHIDDAVQSSVEDTLNALQRGSGPDSAVHNGSSGRRIAGIRGPGTTNASR
jgi:hypothetical protein